MRLISGIFCLLMVFCSLGGFALADESSTNYQMTSDDFPGGGAASVTSTNYAIESSAIGGVSTPAMTSTNYGVGGSVGGGAQAPEIVSISPADFSRYYTDQSASYTVTAVSPIGATLQYQAKDGTTVKAGPQSSNALSWALSGSDKGRRALSFQVLDSTNTTNKPQSAYFFRRPIK